MRTDPKRFKPTPVMKVMMKEIPYKEQSQWKLPKHRARRLKNANAVRIKVNGVVISAIPWSNRRKRGAEYARVGEEASGKTLDHQQRRKNRNVKLS